MLNPVKVWCSHCNEYCVCVTEVNLKFRYECCTGCGKIFSCTVDQSGQICPVRVDSSAYLERIEEEGCRNIYTRDWYYTTSVDEGSFSGTTDDEENFSDIDEDEEIYSYVDEDEENISGIDEDVENYSDVDEDEENISDIDEDEENYSDVDEDEENISDIDEDNENYSVVDDDEEQAAKESGGEVAKRGTNASTQPGKVQGRSPKINWDVVDSLSEDTDSSHA